MQLYVTWHCFAAQSIFACFQRTQEDYREDDLNKLEAITPHERMKSNELMGTLRYWNRICPKLLVPQKTQSTILNSQSLINPIKPFTPKIEVSILHIVCHTLLLILDQRI